MKVPEFIAEEHRHAYLGGVWSRRNGLTLEQNPYEDPGHAAAWRRGYVEAEEQ